MHAIIPDKKLKGHRLKLLLVLLAALILAGQIFMQTVSATPVAPVALVNHTLRQCLDQVILADECYFCTPVAGWEILPSGQCPADYAAVPQQARSDLPLNCVQYPKNDWAACSWGVYPTMTLNYPTLTSAPEQTVTAPQPVVPPPTPSAAPVAPALDRPSSNYLMLSILCLGCAMGITITAIVWVLLRKKK